MQRKHSGPRILATRFEGPYLRTPHSASAYVTCSPRSVAEMLTSEVTKMLDPSGLLVWSRRARLRMWCRRRWYRYMVRRNGYA